MNQPQTQEYPEWYERYISLVEGDVIEILEKQISDFSNFINNLIEKGDYAYAPGKWTIKELVGHIIDTERIMAFRLTCFARNEKGQIPGFEEDEYVANANFKARSLFSLSEEFAQLRKANMFLIKSLNDEELARSGNANGNLISVKALVYVLAGHIIHHTNVIKERYL
ncbi:DinB family protein [Pedobacter polaris]|uniref:DinB family protein n=1 Tax=Pedobacter polaris TaxID=2571273 RepID=A0A4U1CYR2_9SPHI|nr:DinB family protein [Pedobacter polaris]TKC12528.1 DinB family protein [Pedobacter polaris]